MEKPVQLERRATEGMQFTGSWENTAAIIDWIESHGDKADWLKPGLVWEEAGGKKMSEPRWMGERLLVKGKRSFVRFVFVGSWVLIDSEGMMQTMTDEVKQKLWKEVQ